MYASQFLIIFIIIYCSYYFRKALFLLFIVVIRYSFRFYYYLLFLLYLSYSRFRANIEKLFIINGLQFFGGVLIPFGYGFSLPYVPMLVTLFRRG